MSAGGEFTSAVGSTIAAYVSLKEALGRSFRGERRILAHLDCFLAARATDLTTHSYADWCRVFTHLAPSVRRNWMRVARNMCLYRQRSHPRCFVPDPLTFPRPHAPRPPHFFTEDEITRILRATSELDPTSNSPLRREVYRLAVVLLYTAGLRRGELARLTVGDYDPEQGTLAIRATKFHKSRVVPLSKDALREMECYLKARRCLPLAPDSPLLCNRSRGLRRYAGGSLGRGLRQLFDAAGIRTAAGRAPRVHDFRHSFAHRALLRWYRAGVDVQARLPALATYMGHVSVASTQYYLSLLEPLAEAASERFARHCRPVLGLPRGRAQ